MKYPAGVIVEENWLPRNPCSTFKQIYDAYGAAGSQEDYTRNKVLHLFDLKAMGHMSEYDFMKRVVLKTRDEIVRLVGLTKPLYVEAAYLAKLPEGGRHPMHRDNCMGDGTPNHTPQRDYSALIYLNSVFEGGEIVFPSRGTLKPKTGMLIAFPSGKDYPHEVLAVTKGVRYSLPLWFSLRPAFDMFRGNE